MRDEAAFREIVDDGQRRASRLSKNETTVQ